MFAVLFVGHGSRKKDGMQQVDEFLHRCMKKIKAPIQQICYLELVQPNISEGIRRCALRGADKIIVQPLLLLSAGHHKRDIPEEIRKARSLYPKIIFYYGRPFGVDQRIVDVLIERLNEQRKKSCGTDEVLLVGRGSSDPEVQKSFAQISELLHERGFRKISVCYLAASRPTLSEGLSRAAAADGRVFLIPYLLFSGILTREIHRALDHRKALPNLILCRPLGYHPMLIEIMRKKIEGLIANELST